MSPHAYDNLSRRRRTATLLLLTVLSACGPTERATVHGVVRDGRTGEALAGAFVRGPGSEARADETGRFTLSLPVDSDVQVRAAVLDRCPGEARVDVHKTDNAPITVNLFPRLEVEDAFPQVGFDRELRVTAQTRCDDDAVLQWRQLSGPDLGDRMRIEDDGRTLVVRTHPIGELVEPDPRLGMLPLSRKQRGDYRFELAVELPGGEEKREVRITAAPTSAGVFQVPTGGDVYLNGGENEAHRWTLLEKPERSAAEMIDPESRTPHFRADLYGQYMVRYEPTGLDINIQAGPYEEVPRDCGREGCHRAEDQGWLGTAHARTFQRGLEGELGDAFDETCWGCHATGVDFRIENGGLHRTAARLGWSQPDPHEGAFAEAPRTIRRHGSVWCSACHGPGRILPPQFHWEYGAKYQAGVCARCHDAVDDPDSPHQSWQYREWSASAMATFVRGEIAETPVPGELLDPALRLGCASCHSAQGFIAWRDTGSHVIPERGSVAAIACTTCHDPHDATHPSALRVFDRVDVIGGKDAEGLGAGALCATCHRTGIAEQESDAMAPHAPQADVLLGRGSQLLREPVPGAHSRLAQSCVACHMARPPEGDPLLGRAGGHTFSVRDTSSDSGLLSAASCASCHGTETPPQALGGIRDWDGDGNAEDVGRELDRGLREARAALRERIEAARVHDECAEPRLARDFVEREALLLLTDDEGTLLGDCDADGRFTGRESPVTVAQISRALRKVVWDLSLIEKDGSRGRHNPTFTFRLLTAIRTALR